jgi:predicted permease
MTRLRVLWRQLAGLFRKGSLEEDLDQELKFHLEMETSENQRKGMSAEKARSEAMRQFGGLTQIKETYRETHALPLIPVLWQDIRFGFRMLRRTPGFSILAILCLTLGIGATTSVFSWIEGILLRPFPAVDHQERLVAIAGTARFGAERTDVSWPDFQDLQRNCGLLDSFIVDRIMGTTLAIGDRAERVTGSVVSANYFDALKVRPVLGRGFEPPEDFGRNAHAVTVISYQTWKDRYSSDPATIGRTQMLNGVKHTVIGVAPEGFYGTFVGYSFQFWVPASMQEVFDPGGYKLEDRGARWIEGFARLKPGVTIEQAQAEVSAVTKRLEIAYPTTNRGRGIKLFPLWQTPFNNAGTLFPTLRITLVVVCFVLLIACANVGNLLIVRSFARRHEMTVRLAIGARRGRLVRQLLTEGLILSAFAAAGGLMVAYWCRNMMVLFFPSRPGVTVYLPAEIDWRVLAVSVGICLISTVLSGLVPAMQTSKIDLAAAMKADSGGVVGGRGRAWIRSSLVLVQVSLSFVLLVGVGLLLKSLEGLRNVSPGFSTENVLTTGFDLVGAGYDAGRAKNFQDQLIDRVQALPGVQSAAFARITPFSYRGYFSAPIAADGYQTAPDEQPTAEYNQIGPGYLATMGTPLINGREFTRVDNESAPPVAIINEAMAAQYWRGRDPVGERLQVKGRWMKIVGVAKNAKYRTLLELPKPFFYIPLRQDFSIQVGLNVRTRIAPAAMAAALAREARALDASLALSEVITMREQVDRMSWTQRAAAILLGIFGGLALVLSAIGLYGVMSYAVSQRTRELGLRMALGADGTDLLRLVLSQGLGLTAGGVVVGIAAALVLTNLIANLLFNVSPRDPVTFMSAFAVMAVVASAACLLPALRATRTDPVRALRE